MFQNLSNQKKGSLLAFIGVMFITPDSLFIRLANADTYQLLFYRGSIPFVTVLIALLVAYKSNFIRGQFYATKINKFNRISLFYF